MATTFTSFRDLVLKALPISKRGASWIDWNYTATSPIRYVNDLFYQRALDLDALNSHSISTKSIPELLNDLYDPFHRNITVTNDNVLANTNCYYINVPTYLAFGDYEEIMQDTLNKFLYIGLIGTFQTYATGVAHEGEDYLNELVSNLVGDEILTNNEIWAVQYVYNQLKGASLLTDFATLHLYSQSSKINAEVDFMSPTSAGLIEVPASDGMDWNKLGTKSLGTAYYRTGNLMSALISDVDNNCSVLYISEDAGVVGVNDFGIVQGSNTNHFASEQAANSMRFRSGQSDDVDVANTSALGGYLMYTDTGVSNILKGSDIVGVDQAINVASAVPTIEDFVNALNNGGTPINHSGNRIGTWGRINASWNAINRKFVNNVLIEYNNRLNR
jgi:hypothetical protein